MPEAEHDIVRPGMAIYGGKYNEFGTKNVSSLTSQIISLRILKLEKELDMMGHGSKGRCIIGSIPMVMRMGFLTLRNPSL